MRVALIGVGVLVGAVSVNADLTPWLTPTVVSGVFTVTFLKLYTRREAKRLDAATAETQEQVAREAATRVRVVEENLREDLLKQVRADHAHITARIAELLAEQATTQAERARDSAERERLLADLARKDTDLARKETIIVALRSRLESLHDQLLAAEAGVRSGRRRGDVEDET